MWSPDDPTGFEPSRRWKFLSINSTKRGYPIENIVALLDEPGMTVEETIERILSTRERKPKEADPRRFVPPARATVPSQMPAGCHSKMRDLTPLAVLRRGMGPPKRGGPWAAKKGPVATATRQAEPDSLLR